LPTQGEKKNNLSKFWNDQWAPPASYEVEQNTWKFSSFSLMPLFSTSWLEAAIT
jgi:hypothetical protein